MTTEHKEEPVSVSPGQMIVALQVAVRALLAQSPVARAQLIIDSKNERNSKEIRTVLSHLAGEENSKS